MTTYAAAAMVLFVTAAVVLLFFWYLPGRDTTNARTASAAPSTTLDIHAADAEAQALLRRAMAALESAHLRLTTFDPGIITPAVLALVEPTITFIVWPADATFAKPAASAASRTVNYKGNHVDYALGTMSASGRSFGIIASKDDPDDTWYCVDGQRQNWGTGVTSTTTPP